MKNQYDENLMLVRSDGAEEIIEEVFNMGALAELLGGVVHICQLEVNDELNAWFDGDAKEKGKPLNEKVTKLLGGQEVYGDVLLADEDYFYK